MSNGFQNEQTFKTYLYMYNDNALYPQIRAFVETTGYKAKGYQLATMTILYWPSGYADVKKIDYLSVNWDEIAEMFNEA